jgi:thiol-disulfide isomerase/thioredoxin
MTFSRIHGPANTALRVWSTALLAILSLAVLLPGAVRAQATGLEVQELNVGQPAPVFVMKKAGSADFVFLRDYAGELRQSAVLSGAEPRIVVLSFFASWCKPCAEEMPELTTIGKAWADRDVQVFFVNLNEQDSVVLEWMAQHPGIEGTVLMDPYAENAVKYGVDALPRTIIIDREGVVRFIERGFSPEGYRQKVETALREVTGG